MFSNSSPNTAESGFNSSNSLMDSNVVRLIRRYDPASANVVGLRARRSLESNRNTCQKNGSKVASTLSNTSSVSCSFLPQQIRAVIQDDREPLKPSAISRLERQRAGCETNRKSSSPVSNNPNTTVVKNSWNASTNELSFPMNKIEPLTIEIEPYVPSPTVINQNKNVAYQPLVTTGTKNACTAVSKSEWDIRSQNESISSNPPKQTTFQMCHSPSPQPSSSQQLSGTSYRPLFSKCFSAAGVDIKIDQDDTVDDLDENSAPIVSISSVQRLKNMFITKSSVDLSNSSRTNQQRSSSTELNNNRCINNLKTVNMSKTDSVSSLSSIAAINSSSNKPEVHSPQLKPTNAMNTSSRYQEHLTVPSTVSPLKTTTLKNQKMFTSTESLNPSNNSVMPSSEVASDAYRLRRLNSQDQLISSTNSTSRFKNIAKVEPYSINTNAIRPLYQSSTSPSPSQPAIKITSTNNSNLNATTTATPMTRTTTMMMTNMLPTQSSAMNLSQERPVLNSVGTTPTTSTPSSAGSVNGIVRHPNIRQSDFLVPNPTYGILPSFPNNSINRSQPLSNNSNYSNSQAKPFILSEPFSHGSIQRFPLNDATFYKVRSIGSTTSINDHQPKQKLLPREDFQLNKQNQAPFVYQTNDISRSRPNLVKQESQPPPISYQYHQRFYPGSTTALHTSHMNDREKYDSGLTATSIPDQQGTQQKQDERMNNTVAQQNQVPRRRFHRRKQMKRSKSADIYQEQPTGNNSNTSNTMQNPFFKQTGHDPNRYSYQQPRSTSRELIETRGQGDDQISSSSSESSASTAHIERINRAALLRFKSLDSMTFNNRSGMSNGRNQNRRVMSKPMNMDLDSDDSVCGIPKPRKTIGR